MNYVDIFLGVGLMAGGEPILKLVHCTSLINPNTTYTYLGMRLDFQLFFLGKGVDVY